jgi:hypothetical protein
MLYLIQLIVSLLNRKRHPENQKYRSGYLYLLLVNTLEALVLAQEAKLRDTITHTYVQHLFEARDNNENPIEKLANILLKKTFCQRM